MSVLWWHWVVLGVALMVLELAAPGLVLFWFGLGALAVAALSAIAPDLSLTVQLAAWTLLSAAMLALWFRIVRPGLHKSRIGLSSADVVGETGLLVRDVEPFGRGSVRFQKPVLGSEVWECIADEALRSGDRVRVLAIEGNLFKVGKA